MQVRNKPFCSNHFGAPLLSESLCTTFSPLAIPLQSLHPINVHPFLPVQSISMLRRRKFVRSTFNELRSSPMSKIVWNLTTEVTINGQIYIGKKMPQNNRPSIMSAMGADHHRHHHYHHHYHCQHDQIWPKIKMVHHLAPTQYQTMAAILRLIIWSEKFWKK